AGLETERGSAQPPLRASSYSVGCVDLCGVFVVGSGCLDSQWAGAWGDGDGQGGFAHEVAVGGSGGGAALGDGPDDKGLAATVVAGDVDRWFESGEKGVGFGAVLTIAHHAAALVEGDAELVDVPAAF